MSKARMTAANGNLRVVGYVRCSTQEQADNGMSLDTQRARITAWADATGADLVEVIEDAGVSGTKPLANRAGGARVAALLAARTPDVDAVVVLRLDRLGRNAAETLALLRRFQDGKVGLFSISDRLDLATPQGRAMAQVTAVFSELERALIAQRTKEGLAELKAQGRAWNHAPFGYNVVDGHLAPNADEQATLARAVELRDAGKSYHAVAAILTAEGRSTKRGGPWAAMSVRSVLRTSAEIAA